MEVGERVHRAKVEMLGGGEVGLISGRRLDFELWDAGSVSLCQWPALPLGQYRNVVGSLSSVVVPSTV